LAGGAALLGLVVAGLVEAQPLTTILMTAGMVSPLFVLLAFNTLLGPTCVCRLHTAVQVEDVVALRRLRAAQRAIAIVKPLIEAAQGRLADEDLAAYPGGDAEVRASAHARTATYLPGTPALAQSAGRRSDNGRVHVALFFTFFLVAVDAFVEIFHQNTADRIVSLLCLFLVIALAVAALVRQRNSDLPAGIKNLTRVGVAAVLASFIFGSVYATVHVIRYPEIWEAADPLSIRFEGPVYTGWSIVEAVVFSSLAALGLLRVRAFRAVRAQAEARGTGLPEEGH